MKRINLFTGHFGSGKTEMAINFAKKLKKDGIAKVTIVDLDIVNPYFCSRDLEDELKEEGIRIISQGKHLANAELMVVPGEVMSAFQQLDHTVVFDIGGDDMGATALGQYKRFFQEEDYDMFFVVNTSRPMTREVEEVKAYLDSIEHASRLKVTALINNSNMSYDTSLEVIRQGEDVIKKLSEMTGLPHVFTAVRRDLAERAREVVTGEIFPIDIYMKPPWID